MFRSIHIFTLKILGAVLSVLLGALISNIYGVEFFGQFSVLLVLINTLAIVGAWGLGVNYLTEYQQGKHIGRDLGTVILNLSFCLMVLPIALIAAKYFVLSNLWKLVPVFIIASLLITKMSFLTARELQIANAWFDDILRIALPLGVVTVGAGVSIKMYGQAVESGFLLAYIIAHIALFIAALLYMNAIVNFRQGWGSVADYIRIHFQKILKNGAVVTLSMVLILLLSQSDRLILSRMIDARLLGIYAIAQVAVNVVFYAVQSVMSVITPDLVRALHVGDLAAVSQLSAHYSKMLFAFSLIALLGTMLLGQYFFLMYGVTDISGVYAMVVLMAGQVVSQFFGFGITIATYTLHIKVLIATQMFSLLLSVVLCFSLTMMFGIIGAAISTATSMILVRVVLWFYFRKQGIQVGVR